MRSGIIVCAAGVVASSASAQFTVFDNRAAWEAALGGAPIVTEDFNSLATGEIADGASLNTGLITITRDGSANLGDGALAITDGSAFGNFDGTNHLDGETGIAPHEKVNVSFNGAAAIAFGGDFVSPFSGDGIGVQIGSEIFLLDGIAGFGSGFFGVIADSGSFGSIDIVGTADDISFQELWQADNFSYAVPAPASAALLGLGGLAAARRRR